MKNGVSLLLAATLLVGMALGTGEAAWILKNLRNVPAIDVLLLALYGCLGYGITAVVVAMLWLPVQRYLLRQTPPEETQIWSVAVGCATAAFCGIQFVLALVQFGNPRLLVFVPACLLSGAVCGWIAAALVTSVLRPLQKRSTWAAVTMTLLLIVAVLALYGHRERRMHQANAVTPLKNEPMNILLISVDTLRTDRLGCYGYKTASTPNIDKLAGEGVLFEDATAPIPITGPSHTTMLTGLYPWNHGVTRNGVPIGNVSTLPEMLARVGYKTAAFISGWTLKDYSTNLAGRFDVYEEDFATWGGFPDILLRMALPKLFVRTHMFLTGHPIFKLERPAEVTTTKALSWLSGKNNQPFFLFVHFFDVHEPHLPPAPFDRLHPAAAKGEHPFFLYNQPTSIRQSIIADPAKVDHIKGLYDGEISYVDQQIGRLLNEIGKNGQDKNLLVIFTADHGQSLGEHQAFFTHGEYLYETCVHVPLIFRFPDRTHAGVRHSNQVRLTDITPTILSMLELKSKIQFDGDSLLPVLNGTERTSRISYGALSQLEGEHERSRYYVKKDGFKLIWNFDMRKEFSDVPALEELYDLRNDPAELQNLVSSSNPMLEPLRKLMAVHVRHKRLKTDAPDEEVQEALESLGYL
jgi:arylsulfatase A-like enzyme